MDRMDYLKEKSYKMQAQLNSLYIKNGDIGQIQKIKSQLNAINFELNRKNDKKVIQNDTFNTSGRDIFKTINPKNFNNRK